MSTAKVTSADFTYWFIRQLYSGKALPNHFLNIRVIHNKVPYINDQTGRKIHDTQSLFNKNLPVNTFKETFQKTLYQQLVHFNLASEMAANIYFGINPRNTIMGNKKEHVVGFVTFYLDLDDSKGYSREDRAKQIDFWKDCGFEPSIVVDSGNGYHAYWILKFTYDGTVGEQVLKRMVALAGCKAGGNTWDRTRVFRLPGFKNQKTWYENKTPLCKIIHPSPEAIVKSIHSGSLVKQYEIEDFEAFPPSRKEDIQSYVEKAHDLSGDYGKNLKDLVAQTAAEIKHKAVDLAAKAEGTKQTVVGETAKLFTPKIDNLPPDLGDMNWPKGQKKWMVKYCQVGFDGLTAHELETLKSKFNIGDGDDCSASSFDFRIIFALIKQGYSLTAVDALWNRPGLKLFREEKFAKNPNYLPESYKKALTIVQDSLNNKDPLKKIEAMMGESTLYIKDRKVFMQKNDNIIQLMNGEPVLKGIYIDKDADMPSEREYYHLHITVKDHLAPTNESVHEIVVSRDSFSTAVKFRKHCSGKVAWISDRGSELQKLVLHLHYTSGTVPCHDFHSKLSYNGKSFIFPKLIISKDKFTEVKTFDLVPQLQAKFPWHDYYVSKACPKEEAAQIIKDTWNDVLKLHLPRLVMCTLGVVAASAVRAILKHHKLGKGLQIPTLNIRGGTHTGKSETVKLLYSLACVENQEEAFISTHTTEFALNRMVELCSFVPILIDEFREDEPNDKHCARIRNLVRRAYTGEQMVRGRADQGLNTYRIHGSPIVVGETVLEVSGDMAGLSRTIPIDTDEFTNQMDVLRFDRVQSARLEKVGPHFYQWLLTQDPEKMRDEIKALKLEIHKDTRQSFGHEIARISNNLAVIYYGCKLWDRFVEYMAPGTVNFENTYSFKTEVVKHLCNWAKEEGHSLSYTKTEEVKVDGVVTVKKEMASQSKNELMKFIEDFSYMVTSKDESLTRFDMNQVAYLYEDEKKEELGIHLKNAISAHTLNSIRMRVNPISKAKLTALLRAAELNKSSFLKKLSHVKFINGKSTRFLVFDLSVLREMGVWHDQSESGDANMSAAAAD